MAIHRCNCPGESIPHPKDDAEKQNRRKDGNETTNNSQKEMTRNYHQINSNLQNKRNYGDKNSNNTNTPIPTE